MAYIRAPQTDGSVLTCTVSDCTYNRAFGCHAPRIQVDNGHPACSTYTHDAAPLSTPESSVVLCLSLDCLFNTHAHCTAHGVTIGTHAGHADCVTFREDSYAVPAQGTRRAARKSTIYARY